MVVDSRKIQPGKGICLSCGRFDKIDESCVCFWCHNKGRQSSSNIAAKQRHIDPFTASGVPRYITLEKLQTDIRSLVPKIPSDITAVVGVARSGMNVATVMSMLLHKPLYAIRQTDNDVICVGNGWRLGGAKRQQVPRGKVVIIDDTVMTGNSLRAIDHIIKANFDEAITAAVYVNPFATKKPDIHSAFLNWPHLLEWNLFNSVLSPNVACDFDGILCEDCKPGQDDDGERYRDFILNARPLYTPRRVPIPMVVTARIEKYRKETQVWLNRHGIIVHKLIMFPANTLKERQRQDIAEWKAKTFARWNNLHKPVPPPNLFIESDNAQAKRISELSGLMTICPASGKVYCHGQ